MLMSSALHVSVTHISLQIGTDICRAVIIQVMQQDGSWEQLLVPEGHIAVLAGYTLERATCGLVKAVTHRVVCFSSPPHACAS